MLSIAASHQFCLSHRTVIFPIPRHQCDIMVPYHEEFTVEKVKGGDDRTSLHSDMADISFVLTRVHRGNKSRSSVCSQLDV